MNLLVLAGGVLATAGIQLLRKHWFSSEKEPLVWSSHVDVPLAPDVAIAAVRRTLSNPRANWSQYKESGNAAYFRRGDWTADQMDLNRGAAGIPLLLSVTAQAQEQDASTVYVAVAMPHYSSTDVDVPDLFRDLAKIEFDLVSEILRIASDELHKCPAALTDEITVAYQTLKLRPDASWLDVQTAYHEACKQYHPDWLSGQNVPPHLVDLAVKQFKEMTAAYQTLQQHLAA